MLPHGSWSAWPCVEIFAGASTLAGKCVRRDTDLAIHIAFPIMQNVPGGTLIRDIHCNRKLHLVSVS